MPTARQITAAEIVVRMRADIAELKKAMQDGTGEIEKFSRESKARFHEAQGSIALLGDEIGVRLPRHLRSFVTELPGVATAMSAAFNTIAVIGLINIVVEAGEKVAEFFKKQEEAAAKNHEAWEKIGDNITGYADNLRVSNDKLDETIAKLEHKPFNGMKLAIDESVQSATTLGQKLKEDLGLISETLEKQKVGLFSQMFGTAGTGDLKEHIEKLRTDLSDIEHHEREALKDLGPNAKQEDIDAVREKFYGQRSAKFGFAMLDINQQVNEAEALQKQRDTLLKAMSNVAAPPMQTGAGVPPDQFDRIRQLKELREKLEGLGDVNDLENEHREKQTRADKDQAAQEAKDAFERSNQERLEQLQKELAEKKYQHQMILSEEAVFWMKSLQVLDEGSKAYAQAQQRAAELSERVAENYRVAGHLRPKFKEEREREAEMAPRALTDTRGAEAIDAANEKDALAKAQQTAAYTLLADRIGLVTGALNVHEAAIRDAQARYDDYTAKVAALRHELELLHQNDWMGMKDNTAREIGLQTQLNELDSQYKIQSMMDAQNVLATTWKGMIDSVFDEVIAGSQHATQEVRDISSNFINSMNGEIAKVITNQHFDFSGIFRTGAESLAKLGLSTIEGSILKSLGLGKRDGSTEDQALWVQMKGGSGIPDSLASIFTSGHNVVGPGGSSALMGAAGKSMLGFLNDSNFFTKGFLGNFFGAGGAFGGARALGGDVMGGVPYTVGELGPETFVPAVSGSIIPTKHTMQRGGDIHIDARGTDPALTRENVFHAMQAARSAGARDAVHAMAERQRRRA